LVDEVLSSSLERMAEADALVVRAQSAPQADRDALLAEALRLVADHERAKAALEAVGVEPPGSVDVRRDGGAVLVSWTASPTAGEIRYRVRRLAADGRARAVGVTSALSLSDGGAPGAGPLPEYEVSAGHRASGRPRPAGPRRSRRRHLRPPRRRDLVAGRCVGDGVETGRDTGGAVVSAAADTASAVPAPPAAPAQTAADAVPPVTGLRADGGMLRWVWPAGCTEMMVAWRADAALSSADDRRGMPAK
jgi:hypothetical protein